MYSAQQVPRLLLVGCVAIVALATKAEEPPLVHKLGLASVKHDEVALYYEKEIPGDPKATLAGYEALLSDLAKRSAIGGKADAMIDQVNVLVGSTPSSAQRDEQRTTLQAFAKLTNFMPKTLCIARQ